MLDDSLDQTEHLDLTDQFGPDSSPDNTEIVANQAPQLKAIIRQKDAIINSLKKEMLLMSMPDAERALRAKLADTLRKTKYLTAALEARDMQLAKAQAGKEEVSEFNDTNLDYRQKYLRITNYQQVLRQELAASKTTTAKLRKCLVKELGTEEAVDLALIHAEDADQAWRGRAQQIALLQKQVRDLSRLKPAEEPIKSKNSESAEARRLEVASLQEEVRRLADLEQESKTKLKAARARMVVLETDAAEAKSAAKLLREKSTNDDELIRDLRQFVEVKASAQIPNLSSSKEIERLKLQCERQKEIIAKLREKN